MAGAWLMFSDVCLVDGTRNAPSEPTGLLVEGDRIRAVGSAEALWGLVPRAERESVAEVAGRHRILMPGLIDAHCHMTYGDSKTQEEQDLYTSVESRTLRAAFNCRRVLRAGVTSISQPGGSWYIGVALREAITQGMVLGPRMRTAGRYITTSNGLTDWYPEAVGVPDGSIGVLANTPAEMVDNVRRQVKNGVDFIKLADSPFGEYQSFTGDELKQIADLAHQLGRQVTIHARGSAETAAALAAGFDWIMHGNIMTDEVIQQLADSQTPLVPTLLLLANAADFGAMVGTPIGFRDGCRRMLDRTAETYHRAHAAGVLFALGTDSGFAITPYGEWHARELELLMEYAGLTAQEAIAAGTTHGARTVGLEGEIGSLREGMLADLLLLSADPLQDIRVLQDRKNVEAVFVGGREIVFDGSEETAWPNDRAIVYADGTLTYESVRQALAEGGPRGATPAELAGEPPKGSDPDHRLLERRLSEEGRFTSESKELVHEVAQAGRAAAQPELD